MGYVIYPSSSSTNFSFIGEIPKQWSLRRLKFGVSKVGSGITPKGGAESYELEGIPLLRSQNIHFDGLRLNDVVYIGRETHDEMGNSQVHVGDVLINITGASIGRCYYFDGLLGEANVNQHVCIIRPEEGLETKFLYYCLRSELGQQQILLEQSGSGREGLNFESLKNFVVPSITPTEQKQIADFLDWKTGQIDALIARKKQLIDKLREQRIAVITQAVTKGLNPNAPLRDSGIPWLGEIPEHWKIKRLRYLGETKNGVSEGADYFGSGFPFVSYSDVYKNEKLPLEVRGLAKSSIGDQQMFSVQEGDVLFTRTSETAEEIGYSSTCFATIAHAIFAGFLIRFRPEIASGLTKEYSRYYFRSSIHRSFFNKEMNLVTRVSLGQELLRNLPVLLPPENEQEDIGRYLDSRTNELDLLANKVEQAVSRLTEYRTALITAATTGKIDVREVQIPKAA